VTAVVVLLGPPGSGKSAVGAALRRHGFRWRDWEQVLVDRWGSRDAFVEHKASALPQLHDAILEWLAEDRVAAVLETTGLSDAPLLGEIRRRYPSRFVRLDVSEETALDRVRSRPGGAHLSDEVEDNRRVWRAFDRLIRPHQPVDLVVDTESSSVDATASAVAALSASRS
jgi:dephospho-CoA kinase